MISASRQILLGREAAAEARCYHHEVYSKDDVAAAVVTEKILLH